MIFDDLFRLDFQQYLYSAFVPKQTIVYVHMPKCSGTSSINALKNSFEHVWHFEYTKIDEQWDLFLKRMKSDKHPPLDLAAGHFWHWHLDSLRENEIPRHCITFLRHPIERLVSEYRYMCTPAHPPSQEFVKECPTFEAFVERRVQPNEMARILYNGVTSVDEYLDRLKQDFTFIGLSEFYHLSMALLMKALDRSYFVLPRDNITESNDQNAFEVTRTAFEQLTQSQHLDLMVYDYLQRQYAALSDRFIGQVIEGNLTV